VPRPCQVCGRIFYGVKDINGRFGSSNVKIAKYCSKACWSVRATVINKCKNCGKEIKTFKSANKKYCDIKCRNEGYKNIVGLSAYQWKGDDAGYSAKHKWLHQWHGKAKQCEECGSIINVQWANISGEYRRDLDDWRQLCAMHHRLYDNYRKRNGE
jgi:hypothetical protein